MSDASAEDKRKIFVLDTNVLLHNAAALTSFADNIVVLPMKVIEELDTFKGHGDELGRSARQVIRKLDSLRAQGSLREGVPLENGGRIQVVTAAAVPPPGTGLDADVPDNRILATAYAFHRAGKRTVIFVSKDINARIKADALGITAMDFEKQKVDFDTMFTGWRTTEVSPDELDSFFSEKHLDASHMDLNPNEFVILKDNTNPKHSGLARHDHRRKRLVHLVAERNNVWNVSPRSAEQRMAIELLLDESVKLVTLVGQAGTGKTLLALAAGLHLTLKMKAFEKILVHRPIVPLGRDIGYLPGTKQEKLSQWMMPIFDNLKFLTSDKSGRRKGTAEELVDSGMVELEALTYIRGRSIADQFLIVDEAQNLTPHEVKTIISRAGEGTKMVLTGDPYQIDNPYLDASSNGLTYSVERLKTSTLFGHITLSRSERSELAALAAEVL